MSTATMPSHARFRDVRGRPAIPATVRTLKNIRWAVRAALVIGVAASVGANILHAQPHPISQAIAAWPPIALLLTVELISRVPVHRRILAAARLVATTLIAGIAAWVSYWHMVGVAVRYGETGLSAYLLPISVDGLIVVASISLVELSARLHLAHSTPPPMPAPLPARSAPSVTEPPPAPAGHPPIAPTYVAPDGNNALDKPSPPPAGPANLVPGNQTSPDADADPRRPDGPAGEPPHSSSPDPGDDAGDREDDARRPRPRGATRKAVIDAYLADPAKHPTAIADEIGTSERTVRRYLDEFRATAGTSPNGGNGAGQTHNGHPR